ncbi:NADH kinase-like protein POS5, partial [Aureobasidium melanogenum]
MTRPCLPLLRHVARRCFSQSHARRELRDIAALPDRIRPSYQETKHQDLLSLQWPQPPRNILIVHKSGSDVVAEAVHEYANHIHSTYPGVSLIFEPKVARALHADFSFPIYTTTHESKDARLQDKVDLTSTLGGDGTILHASSLFANARNVPPILSFSMGTLGFLGEWKFSDYKRALREVYMSGATAGYGSAL